MAWDERVYGREYDLDVFNIVAVDDFNFGAMENKGLNIFNSRYILADPGHRDRLRLRRDRRGRRARIFPQLVGRPRHLPRLVPAEPQGRLHRLPRPGAILRRPGQSAAVKRIEDVRSLRAAQFPEDAGPARASGPARTLSSRSSNFYTATIYNKGAELIRMMATLHGPVATASGRAPTAISIGATGRRRPARISSAAMEEASGIDLTQLPPLVRPGRHAARPGRGGASTRMAGAPPSGWRSARRRRRASPTSSRWCCRCGCGCSARTARRRWSANSW